MCEINLCVIFIFSMIRFSGQVLRLITVNQLTRHRTQLILLSALIVPDIILGLEEGEEEEEKEEEEEEEDNQD